jgi:uncharacterized protein (DUF952 family)
MELLIVHLCKRGEWVSAKGEGLYAAESLEREGFIHCSRPEQVLKVANHFYPKRKDLVLLWIDLHLLSAELCWETSDGEVFPHLYGPLNLDAVIGVEKISPDQDGVFRQLPFPDQATSK